MIKLSRVSRVLAFAGVFAVPATLSAQAFGLNEIGSCAIARGFATTASPCKDASTIYWNPAAATWLTGWSVSGGVSSIALKGSFAQDTTGRRFDANPPTAYVPNAFINYHAADSRAAWGLGFYVPYGLTSQWPDSFPGKFEALKASLQTFYVQPNVAWKLNDNWSVGGGPVWGHSNVELIQALDLSQQTAIPGVTFGQLGIGAGTDFANARLKGSASALGFHVAVSGKLTPEWTFGARFLSQLTFKYDNANATFTQVNTGLVLGGSLQPPFVTGTPVDALVAGQFTSGALVAQKVSTEITHPAQAQGGFAYSGFKNWLLEGDYDWTGWKSFKRLPVNFQGPAAANSITLIENYNNTSALRLGAEYTIPTDGWKLRAGFSGVASAAPPETVTPLLPEQDRSYWMAGVGIPFMKHWALDASYARIATPGSRGRLAPRTLQNDPNQTATAATLDTGVFDLSANIFSVTLKAFF